MAIQASFNARVYVTGTPTGMVAEPTTPLGGDQHQITATAKRILDPSAAVDVLDGGGAYAGAVTIDYLFGTVTLAPAAGGAVTISANYLPRHEITSAYEYDLSLSKTLADTTTFQGGYTKRTKTLGDVSGSLSCYDNTSTSYTGLTLKSVFDSDTPKVLEVDMNGTVLRALVLMENSDFSASVDGVQSLSSSFSCASVNALTSGQEVDYAFGT